MALKTTYVTRNTLFPFWFKSPLCYPDVLVLWSNKDALWAVSSDPHNRPMSGLDVETHGSIPGPVPKKVQVTEVGYSDWYLTSNEAGTEDVQILSVLFASNATTFEHTMDIEAESGLLKTPYDVDTNPKHARLPKGARRCGGELVFSGTNFRLYPYVAPNGSQLLACIDICRGKCHPAWIIDRGARTLFLPHYCANRPIPNKYDTEPDPLITQSRLIWIITLSILLFIAFLFILPVTRYMILNACDWAVDTLAYIIPIEGFSAPLPLKVIDEVTQITRQVGPHHAQVVYEEWMVGGGIVI